MAKRTISCVLRTITRSHHHRISRMGVWVRREHKIHRQRYETIIAHRTSRTCVGVCVCLCIVDVCSSVRLVLVVWHEYQTKRWWLRTQRRRQRRRQRQPHRAQRVYGFTCLPLSYKWNKKISFSVRRPLATETNCFVLSTHSQPIHSRSSSRTVWVCYVYIYAARVCIFNLNSIFGFGEIAI